MWKFVSCIWETITAGEYTPLVSSAEPKMAPEANSAMLEADILSMRRLSSSVGFILQKTL